MVVGFVRKRPSRTRGTRYQSVAVLDDARVQLGTFEPSRSPPTPGSTPRSTSRPSSLPPRPARATPRTSAPTSSPASAPFRSPTSPGDVDAWLSEQQPAGKPLRSRVAHRATLSSVLQWAVDSGLPPNKPVHVVRGPARAPLRRRRPVLKPEQWPQLHREFHDYGPETQLLLDVAIDAGLPRGELADLRAGHVVPRTPVDVKVETVVTWPRSSSAPGGDVVERSTTPRAPRTAGST